MADINDFSDINENFDTIKTLLNTIKAQGILNTSDIDKLLVNINSKLEKINTEEDIELIKAFLSELKKNLDERHGVLISKFGAIESLFSNLLKNSSEAVKSDQLKELFDIVATNLSVFSREVISQKENLSNITLRLDAIQSDDSKKKDIIKNITVVRNDIDKINNGFDSIVISLNENFKTVLKTISEIDQSEAINSFTQQLTDILNSSNTILSAIQLIDKKNNQFEDSFETLATKEDTTNINGTLAELAAKSQELINLVDVLTQKSYSIDNLSEKIDATVNIIAGLKTDIADKDDDSKNEILSKLSELEATVREVSSNPEFKEFQNSLTSAFKEIFDSSSQLNSTVENAIKNISKLNDDFKAVDLDTNFHNITTGIVNSGEDVKEKVVSEAEKLSQMLDINITRTLNDISSNAEVLNSRLKDSHSAISSLCEKSFSEVTEKISGLKEVVTQLDDNNVSANNAIFSNITDRLAIFENSLKNSLEKQEDFVSGSSNTVLEQITNLKGLTEGIEYKLDSNAIELGNTKREFAELTSSVNRMLAIDFVNTVKDLKTELYASKQDIFSALDTAQTEISEKTANDLFGKYELLISKLDCVEEDLKYAQAEAMNNLKNVLANISDSIVDILSYVSTVKDANNDAIENKLSEVTTFIQDSNLNYIENVRDVVDVIRTQVENNLRQISEESEGRLGKIKDAIAQGNDSVRQDLKVNYDKLLEVQTNLQTLNNIFNENNTNLSKNVDNILTSTDILKGDFNSKINTLESSLLEMVTEFKKEFTCENADKISELKFNAENLHSKTLQQSVELKNELKTEIDGIIDSLRKNILTLNELIASSSLKIEGANKEIIDFVKNDFTSEVNNSVETIKTNTADILSEIDSKVTDITGGFNTLENSVNNLSKETTSALSGTLAKILDNFVSLNASFVNLDEKSAEHIKKGTDELKHEFDLLRRKIVEIDAQIDEDLTHQISIIEGSFESLNLMLVDIMNQSTESLSDKIKKELSGVANYMSETLAEELEQYKTQIEDLFEGVQGRNNEQVEYLKNCALELNNVLENTLDRQSKTYTIQLEDISTRLKEMMQDKFDYNSADYETLKQKLNEFIEQLEHHNVILIDTLKTQLDDMAKFVNSNLDIHNQEVNSSFEKISSGIQEALSTVRDFDSTLNPKFSEISTSIDNFKAETQVVSDRMSSDIQETLSAVRDFGNDLNPKFSEISTSIDNFKAETQVVSDRMSSDIQETLSAVRDFGNDLNPKFSEISTSIDNFKAETQVVSDRMSSDIQETLSAVRDFSSDLNPKFSEIGASIDEIKAETQNISDRMSSDIQVTLSAVRDFSSDLNPKFSEIGASIDEIKAEAQNISDKLSLGIEETLSTVRDFGSDLNPKFSEISTSIEDFKAETQNISDKMSLGIQETLSAVRDFSSDLNPKFSEISTSIEDFKAETQVVSDRMSSDIQETLSAVRDIDSVLNPKFSEIRTSIDDFKAETQNISDKISGYNTEFITINEQFDTINSLIENVKQNSLLCKDIISNIVKEHSEIVSKNIEKEADAITNTVIEQFNIIKDGQKDELTAVTSSLEGSISGYLFDAINDLKSYIDIRNNSETVDGKLDALRNDINKSVDETTENINKLLEVSVFTDAITDLRTTNEVLITSMTNKINSQIQEFIKANVSQKMDEKFGLLDKKFIDTIVDKYEEVKLLSTQYNKSFENISDSVNELISRFNTSKEEINSNLKSLINGVGQSVDELKASFADLKSQILNKSFDEAFHASVHNQISGIEDLVKKQMGYIEDISDLCCSNLPELAEMNTIVKHGIQNALLDVKTKLNSQFTDVNETINSQLSDVNKKIESQEYNVTDELKSLKSDVTERINSQEYNVTKELNSLKSNIITQFINIFNQISFVAEQEEILDFIQEKHSELITILSHIVTTADGVENVKDNLAVVDNKLDSLKEDIDLINEKITAIMSSEGDIDYIYSLQDLESDIANLRLVLNEMKADNKTKEFEELLSSTNNIYQIVEAIKSELPKFEADEFKKDFNNLAEDIVSISTRTNKLILTSDESYKTLQDNLQDFKLVIDDLDERTRNFAHEAGIDKLELKLGAINTMIQNGAKTNQVFNQVFEYLAEWVDKAGEQISSISDKVETLDDISQIKLMIEDLRAEANDSANSTELIDALENVFDKQAKRISSLEAKLDKLIVSENVAKKSKTDIKPIEDILNKFLSAIDNKMLHQQDKINSLETKLEEVVSLVDNKDTAQLTKKVGGMDKQLAKLNKSIEKIASNVVEK